MAKKEGSDVSVDHAAMGTMFWADMFVDPKVGSMIPEDLSTKCSVASMIQSDPMVKFDSSFLSSFWPWSSDPIGSLMELVVSDL